MIKYLCAAALFAAAMSPQAAVASAATLFHDGHFAEAITAGRVENTAPGLILAGRSTLIVACFDTTDRTRARALVDAADHDFDVALAKDPGNLEAELMKGQAIGYRGKLTQSPGFAKEARSRFEAVVARDPNNALAWVSLAGWHAAAVATVGKFVASTILGASLKVANADFELAMSKDPKNPAHPAFYGLSLLDLSTDNGARANQLLLAAARLPARDGYEALLRRETAQVLPLLASGDVKGAQTLARKILPFGRLT